MYIPFFPLDLLASGTLPEYQYVGCATNENIFSSDKVYQVSTTGASYHLAIDHAVKNKKKYVAIARYGNDGHVFAFNSLQGVLDANPDKEGCQRVCLDEKNKKCGCSDSTCTPGMFPLNFCLYP